MDLRQIDPTKGTVFVVRERAGLTTDVVQQIAQKLTDHMRQVCMVIVVKDMRELRQLSDEDMARYGWVRADAES